MDVRPCVEDAANPQTRNPKFQRVDPTPFLPQPGDAFKRAARDLLAAIFWVHLFDQFVPDMVLQ